MKLLPFLRKAAGMLFAALVCFANASAINVVNVPAAGQLSSVLPSSEVDSLIVTGFLNSSDFSYMRNNLPKLAYLDLLDATVTNDAIPSSAFSGKITLKTIILPSSVISIGSSAFQNCTILSSVKMPSGLQTLGQSAFSRCSLYGELVLSDSLVSIGNYAFDYNPITKIIFSENLQTIGSQSFYNCTSLSGELVLPSSLSSIGSDAFQSCLSLTSCRINAIIPPTIQSSTLGSIATIYVPQGTGTNYKNASYWNQKLIIEGEPLSIAVALSQPGTLGAKILEQTESLYSVNILTVSGPFNDTDWSQLRNNIPNLISVDLSATTATAVPASQFENKSGLLEIKLPNGLLTIGNRAFYACRGLEKMVIPSTVTSIGDRAFEECDPLREIILPISLNSIGSRVFYSCDRLESVTIPNEVTQIRNGAFYYCTNLKQVVFPSKLNQIENDAFVECKSLSSVQLPNSLTIIGDYAFYNCTSLTSAQLSNSLQTLGTYAFRNCPIDTIVLPATLTNIGNYALNNASIRKITCLQPVPPVLSSDPFNNVNKSTCELVVPFWAETAYRLANIWSQFQTVSTWNAEIDYMPVSGALTLSNNVRPLGTPSVEIMPQGSLNVWGNAPFNTNEFILRHQIHYWDTPSFSQLISENNTMTAQSVRIDIGAYGSYWYYLSFPFDVAISDIRIDNDAYYVFRYYDGASRAAIGSGGSWKNVEQTDTLRAGSGYIFQCNKDVNHLVLPATEASKNRLFASAAQVVTLNEYPAENAANRSWNLVGNPFPSYYDIRCLDYTAPITYWNDYYWNYEAVSPLDDAFLLQPMQAFFVQKPNDLNAITFTPEGRQTSSVAQMRSSLRSVANASRTLINLTLSHKDFADKSRIVLNPDAQPEYETERDAAKFMSTAPEAPQLYSIDGSNVHYAINERPLGEGIIPLGVYAGNAGNYTIAVQEPAEGIEIRLKDKLLGTTIELSSTESYTFSTEAGTFNDRFELHLRATEEATDLTNAGNTKIHIYGAKGAIVVENATESITVYTINGIEISKLDGTGTKTILSVPQGVYIVKVGDKIYKTVVF